ncbi:MAG: CCA tRNA nucleotidyltransferase [Clostridiaceae bacterium]|nr:CCA tRNA nucleotidyltransferase [Clostridiaceae bacterium]
MHIPDEVKTIIGKLEENGHSAYIVGGCVRDMLLGLDPKDFDVCTSVRPETVLELFPNSIPTGLKHGTVTVVVNGMHVEVTTYRIESEYTDHRHPDRVVFSDSLSEDLKRRDFTINAMAYHPVKGIMDPFGGMEDLENRIIRTVGSPEERFGEDALRMLRAIRFQACYGFSIDKHTFSAITAFSENIGVISRERILEELNRILTASYPEAFNNLIKTRLLNHILPVPFSEAADLTQLIKLSEELPVRWSGLFRLTGIHDIDDIRTTCSGLKMSNKLKNEIIRISILLNGQLPKSPFMIRKTLSDAGTDTFIRALGIMKNLRLDITGLPETEEAVSRILSEKPCLSLKELAINGRDLIQAGFKPGTQLGTVLDILFICVLQNPALNRKDILMQFAGIIRQQSGSMQEKSRS